MKSWGGGNSYFYSAAKHCKISATECSKFQEIRFRFRFRVLTAIPVATRATAHAISLLLAMHPVLCLCMPLACCIPSKEQARNPANCNALVLVKFVGQLNQSASQWLARILRTLIRKGQIVKYLLEIYKIHSNKFAQ